MFEVCCFCKVLDYVWFWFVVIVIVIVGDIVEIGGKIKVISCVLD